jgi:hypothetical protein
VIATDEQEQRSSAAHSLPLRGHCDHLVAADRVVARGANQQPEQDDCS